MEARTAAAGDFMWWRKLPEPVKNRSRLAPLVGLVPVEGPSRLATLTD